MEIAEIRKLAGIKRAELCRKYDIPVRTAEDWENGKGKAPEYLKILLERAVREDYGLPSKYYVVEADDDGNEWFLKTTMNKTEALARAEDERYIHERDRIRGKRVEVRLYVKDIEDEDCDCFDYDVIE